MSLGLSGEHFDRILTGEFSIGVFRQSKSIVQGLEKITTFVTKDYLKKRNELNQVLQNLERAKLNFYYCPKAKQTESPLDGIKSPRDELEAAIMSCTKAISDVSFEETLDPHQADIQKLALRIAKCVEPYLKEESA